MSSFFKDKSKKFKADTGQNASIGLPSIHVEGTPPELPREVSSFRKAMAMAKNLMPRASHSRAPSRGPSERRKSQEYLPNLDVTSKPNVGDKDRCKEIKNEHGRILQVDDGKTGSVDKASGGSAKRSMDDSVTKKKFDKSALQDALQASKRQVQDMHTIGGGVEKAVGYGTQSTTGLDKADMAANFLKPLKAFDSVVKGLADVHPYAKAALSVLSWASQAILAQANRDKAIQDLQSRIAKVYEFMLGDGRLEEMISMKDILSQASQVMLECAKFIQVYSQPNFLNRLGKGVFSDTDDAIAKYTKAIDILMKEFNQHAIRDTLTAAQDIQRRTHDIQRGIRNALEDIRQLGKRSHLLSKYPTDVFGCDLGDNQYINGIVYAEGAGLDRSKACLDGTREEILGEVFEWIDDSDPNAPRVLWLSGPAGTGKSAIAHTVARAMKECGTLGSCFCFKKGNVNRYTKLFATISRDMAGRDLQLKHALASIVARDPSVATIPDVTQQWENLIQEPLSVISEGIIGRIVIVIDALDESGDPWTRKHILLLLAKQATALPNNVRILLTSRPLPDIRKAFDGIGHVKRMSMGEIPLVLTERDIQFYISDQLTDVAAEFSPDEIASFAKRADGLFEWARLACNYIMSNMVGLSERERFEILMSQAEREGSKLLDDMYIVILKEVMGERPEKRIISRFRSVMHHVLFTLEPLPLDALITMHRTVQSDYDQFDAESTVLRRMGSLLAGIHDRLTPIRPLHSSFHDFLIDKGRSGEFFVDKTDAHLDLALACLHVMQQELCFNICQLESSYLMNSEVDDLPQRVKKHISLQLSYSCRFLGYHLEIISFNPGVAAVLQVILCTEKILYWIETLSVLHSVKILLQCLKTVVNWLEDHEDYEKAVLTAKDGIQLIQNFGSMISKSAPHLYLSALPFLPQNSILSKFFFMKFPYTAKVLLGQLTAWPPFGCLLTGHIDTVNSVAFSHDGKLAVSGSEDNTIRIWDTEIGLLVRGPIKGHTDPVTSVAFSPDSKLVVSGSKDKTICIWDTETGLLICGPLREHTSWVWSVAFSQSGERFVSGSADKTICIWDSKTGMTIGSPLKGHANAVLCVAFSPNGQRIISGSSDKTIYIWDAMTGLPACGPLQGHSESIWSITFSPDGRKIVSGSDDCTICIWDSETGLQTCDPLQGHTSWITAVAVSPNGKWILSTSSDHTVQVWDIDNGAPLSKPFKPHNNSVRSLAISQDGRRIVSGSFDTTVFIGDVDILEVGGLCGQDRCHIYSVDVSPDGKQIVSGSQNCTVCIWDAESGVLIKGPFKGHHKDVYSVTFSSDGLKIASGSKDCTICVWDAKNGLQIGSAFQGHTDKVWSVCFSPDGQQIASGSSDKTICFWDVNTGLLMGSPIQAHTHPIEAVIFSPDGAKIASCSDDRTICIWDVKTRLQIGSTLTGHMNGVLSVAWSQDGDKIVSGSSDDTIIVWNVNKCLQIGTPLEGHTLRVRSVAFSPDGERILSGAWDKTVRVWNVNDGQQIGCNFKGHTAYVMSVAFFPCGKLAVSGSVDGSIRVWETLSSLNATNGVNFSFGTKHSLCNAEDLFMGPLDLKESWREHVNLNDDGWIVGPQGQLLLWIPIQLRSLLHMPGTVLIIPGPTVELDLSMMAHGKRWIDCFDQRIGL